MCCRKRLYLHRCSRPGQAVLIPSAMHSPELLLIFVRFPERGQVKTRLAAKIGEDAALDLYRYSVADAVKLAALTEIPFVLYCYPHEATEAMAAWLGDGTPCEAQQGNDLGERMLTALQSGLREHDRVVLIGSDIPDLPPATVLEAFAALESHDAVVGPAFDGGYYLIGFSLRALCPALFQSIPWGGQRVFEITMQAAEEQGLTVRVLPYRADIDEYSDLTAFFQRNKAMAPGVLSTLDYLRNDNCWLPAISVIVPVLHEEQLINAAIHCIETRAESCGVRVEIIVVDGGNGDTLAAMVSRNATGIVSEKGRALQMNAGAAQALGDILLFLHVDTQLPTNAFTMIEETMKRVECVAGAFDLEIEGEHLLFRLIGKVSSLRSRLTGIPYGDQAIFIRRDYFMSLGGYSPIPLMEDVELMRRIKKNMGGRIEILKAAATTSGRRWNKEGMIRCTLRNWLVMLLYLLGVSPEKLIKLYPPGP